MNIIADTHTHTLACSHAYSTIRENTEAAREKGLRFLCMTEHGPNMPDAPHKWHFANLKVLPRVLNGIILLKGCEANIMDYNGTLDLSSEDLSPLDWVIASFHPPCCKPGTMEEHTNAWLQIAENPLVDVIGHCGDGRYTFDYDKVIRRFGETGKIVEINANSFKVRPGSGYNCREIAKCCKKYSVPVVLSSDAHFYLDVGAVSQSAHLLEELSFPEELILNADTRRFLQVASEKTGENLEPLLASLERG